MQENKWEVIHLLIALQGPCGSAGVVWDLEAELSSPWYPGVQHRSCEQALQEIMIELVLWCLHPFPWGEP